MTEPDTIEQDFIKSVTHTAKEFDMLANKDAVLVGMSGGPDSVALVLVLMALKDAYNLSIGIAHVNHQLRGNEAQRDEDFSRHFAKKHDLPFYCEKKDIKFFADTNGLSVESAGRKIRYDFFKKTAENNAYTKIATGHHKDDNAELILINLIRGSGPKGLCGIPPLREKKIIRPLIRVSKNEIKAFLAKQHQEFVEDTSNSDPKYLRNKIRHQLIPHLKSEYNPEIVDSLDRLSRILLQEEMFWNDQTQKMLTQCMIKQSSDSLELSKHKVGSLKPALQNRVFRMAIKTVKSDLKRISHLHITSITDFCFIRQSGNSLDLPGQIRIYKTQDTITIKKEAHSLREIGKIKKQLKRAKQRKQAPKS